MIAWLRIDGNPSRVFYMDDRALAFIDPMMAKHKMLLSLGALTDSSEDGSESQNVTIKLPVAAREFFEDDPPIGYQATVDSDVGEQFSGTVQTCTISAADQVPITVEQ